MWTRNHTKNWIKQVESRVNDINYYLNKTVEWCENHYIFDNDQVFMCSFITCVWVSQQRNETITYVELLEMLGLEHMSIKEDKVFKLDERFDRIDHIQVLNLVTKNFKGF